MTLTATLGWFSFDLPRLSGPIVPCLTRCGWWAVLCALSIRLSGQVSVPASLRHFTADDGLPSSEVYDIIQDRQGYLWFSTDNGVSRYNGYVFENFGALQGLTEPVIFYLQEDREGRIWMQAMSGKLYFFEKDRISPFAGNRLIDSLNAQQVCRFPFYVDSSGQVFVSIFTVGLIRFSREGVGTFLIHDAISQSVYQHEDGALAVYCYDENRHAPGDYWKKGPQIELSLHGPWGKTIHEVPAPERNLDLGAALLPDHTLMVWANRSLLVFRDGKMIGASHLPEIAAHVSQNDRGEVFLGLQGRLGVYCYATVDDVLIGRCDTLLEGLSVAHVLTDRDGGRWFATVESGVFYQPDPGLQILDHTGGLTVDYVTSVEPGQEGAYWIGTDGGGLLSLDPGRMEPTPVPVPGSRVFDLASDAEHERLWASVNTDIYFLAEGKWQLLVDPAYSRMVDAEVGYKARNFHFSADRMTLWAVSFQGFLQIDLAGPSVPFASHYDLITDGPAYVTRTLDAYTTSTGRNWIANVDGLFELEDRRLKSPEAGHAAFSTRVEALAELPDSTLVVGSKGYGVVFWKGDSLTSLTDADGLASNMIENLYVDGGGLLWVGTLNGLSRVLWKWGQTPEIRSYTTVHGLPSNEINRVMTEGRTVWVATTRGLARFAQEPLNELSRPPLIARFVANDRLLDPAQVVRLSHRENNLAVDFHAINCKMNGKVPYRYRMDQGEWTTTLQNSLQFPAVPPGERLLEIQARNEDGVWSESTLLRFVIAPPWWDTWAVHAGGLALALLAGGTLYRRRLRKLRRETRLQQRMLELERSALQAQMNPHFIFNCLNSIQNFILQNEKDAAIRYLGRFANLVRSTLHASVSGRISLSEEVQLLQHYLTLEKLRHKDRFTFEVKTEEGLDTFGLEVPPLLIQPYVENAVLHGIAGKETGGRIEVFFSEKEDYLEVAVTDNGTGFETDREDRGKAGHKFSLGMSITRSRLELLTQNGAMQPVQTRTLFDREGQPCGAQVTIQISKAKP